MRKGALERAPGETYFEQICQSVPRKCAKSTCKAVPGILTKNHNKYTDRSYDAAFLKNGYFPYTPETPKTLWDEWDHPEIDYRVQTRYHSI